MISTSLKTFLKPGLAKIILTVTLFALSSYLWRIFIISTISDTFPWGFPLQFYLSWGPCPPGQICSESNLFFFVTDILFWYVGSALLVRTLSRKPESETK